MLEGTQVSRQNTRESQKKNNKTENKNTTQQRRTRKEIKRIGKKVLAADIEQQVQGNRKKSNSFGIG